MLNRLRALLHGWCPATDESYVCSLDRGHPGMHEAWTCGCAGHGRCTEPEALSLVWDSRGAALGAS